MLCGLDRSSVRHIYSGVAVKYLSILVFTTGVVILGMELSASRLLEPAFGNNQIVWATLIGLILSYLAIGSWLGGRLADRFPQRRELDLTLTVAATGVAFIPTVSAPVLDLAALGMSNFTLGLLTGASVAVLLLFSLPAVLLGTASPWAIRLAVQDVAHAGRTAGRYYAIATAGSLVGAFLPVLWLIPAYGTRLTFYLLALMLLAVISVGCARKPYRWIPLLALIGVLTLALLADRHPGIRRGWDDGAASTIIYEDESLYNYIAVRQWGSERHLKLNDGVGIHSVHHPTTVLSEGIWDYFLLAPLFSPAPASSPHPENVLIIGLAAGTVSGLLTEIYGPIPITGIELDPQIIEVGRRYFDMDRPNLTAVGADGRRWLSQTSPEVKWDFIAVDAYRPPYIPFHLTTVEFFQLLRQHLNPDGVVAVNVGRTATNFLLVDTLAATLSTVFPSVHIIDEPGPSDDLGNSLIVAPMLPTSTDDFRTNVAALPESLPPEFRRFAEDAAAHVRAASPPQDIIVFTDDHAPVEQVVHRIILDFLVD
jgi:predicted membrane-bound spermidine synthase